MPDRPEKDNQPRLIDSRRGLLRLGAGSTLLALPLREASAATIVAIRVWPARDYTRITLELDRTLKYNHSVLTNPHRLIVTLEGLKVDHAIRKLISKVKADDPYIGRVRIGRHIAGVVQLIFDLKRSVRPDLFTLAPVARYRHRLVIDLHPTRAPDPLVALLNQQQLNEKSPVLTVTPIPAKQDPLAGLIQRTELANKKAVPRRRVRRPRGQSAPIRRLVTIGIDAGHGGEDPGALGRQGTYEKNIVLPIAAELRQLIRQQPGLRAFMTREGDYFVPLRHRVQKVQRVSADLFVSIHADAAARDDAQGASVYVLSAKGATSTAASWLAARENRADRVGGVRQGLSYNMQARRLLLEMSARRRSQDSDILGRNVLHQLSAISPIHKPNVEKAAFMVLKTPDIPAILVETAFLSNAEDEQRLRSAHYQRRLARAIFDGIRGYLKLGPSISDRQT